MKKSSVLLLAALAVIASSCSKSSGGLGSDNEYAVRTASTQAIEMQTTYPATIKGVQDVEIRPKISGFITELRVSEGQTVSRGQVMFVIDNETYQAAVNQTKAAVDAAEASLNTAKLTYDNSQKLYDNNVIGDYELRSAENSYTSAVAALEQAKANYASAKQNLDFCFVTSPANGVVGDLPYKVGALVSSSSAEPLTTVSDINTMQVYFSMTEKDLLELTKEKGGVSTAITDYPAVQLQLADGSIYAHEGKVVTISGVIDQSTGTVLVKTEFPNPDHLLKSGGAGSILVPHTNSDAIVIPQDAVSQIQDQYFVYVLGEDNKVKHTAITVDANDDGKNYIVTSGLNVGDKYVVSGVTSLSDEMEITPLTEEEYKQKLEDTKAMGGDQGDLSKLKSDFAK
ncbi:MAG: efflux RND transporter periplasmic adaptor subunit [Prevotella sp.]|nr:efflux RND transporter periplasmic adaptor subunit [Prevotella sp.]